MHGAYEDIVSAAETVRNSDLDWTIVRLTMLNNDPKSGKVKAGYVGDGKVGTWISRADIADFMLKQVDHEILASSTRNKQLALNRRVRRERTRSGGGKIDFC